MQYVEALITMFVVFVIPVAIVVALVGAPAERRTRTRRAADQRPPSRVDSGH